MTAGCGRTNKSNGILTDNDGSESQWNGCNASVLPTTLPANVRLKGASIEGILCFHLHPEADAFPVAFRMAEAVPSVRMSLWWSALITMSLL